MSRKRQNYTTIVNFRDNHVSKGYIPKKSRKIRTSLLLYFMAPWVIFGAIWWWWSADERAIQKDAAKELAIIEEQSAIRKQISEELGPYFLHGQFPEEIEMNWNGQKRKIFITYSLQAELQKEADKLLKSYHPDYGSIVILDPDSGRVLAMSSYQKSDNNAPNLALRGTYPAASIFKIITATAAVDKYHISPESRIAFNGANYTLYKKNVMETKRNRWTREISIREAFARSINTVFGRLTFEKLNPKDLQEYAVKFGFNQKIESDLPFDPGFTEIPSEKVFHLAEIASGYNKVTRMSPIQGAMIAGSVANDGQMLVPTVVDTIKDENGNVLYKAHPVVAATTMSPEGAGRLREMMESTIRRGTSSKSFRPLVRDKRFRELELGGKTGSLTGDNPKGKVDWFVGYAIGGEDSKLAVAAITVNIKKWTVKSSYLAQSVFRKHFRDQFSENNAKFFNASTESN